MFLPGMSPEHGPGDVETKVDPGLSADPSSPLRAEGEVAVSDSSPGPRLVPDVQGYVEPRWSRRLKLVLFVLVCVEFGMFLVVIPWYKDVWMGNPLFQGRPLLRSVMTSNFARGAVSGLGLVDLWMGICQAVTYSETRR